MAMNRRFGPGGMEYPGWDCPSRGRDYPLGPGIDYPGRERPDDCPAGATPYLVRNDTDVYALANQLGIPAYAIINYNPELTIHTAIGSGQVICIPNN